MQAQSDGWKIKGLEESVEYLEFALTKVIALLDNQAAAGLK